MKFAYNNLYTESISHQLFHHLVKVTDVNGEYWIDRIIESTTYTRQQITTFINEWENLGWIKKSFMGSSDFFTLTLLGSLTRVNGMTKKTGFGFAPLGTFPMGGIKR